MFLKEELILHRNEVLKQNKNKTISLGDYNIIKSYTSFDPIRVFYARSQGFEIHAHSELELILVLNGNVAIETEGKTFNLFEMDIAVINSHKCHNLVASEYSEVIVLQIQKEFVLDYFGKDAITFENFYHKKTNYKLKVALIDLLLKNHHAPNNHDLLEVNLLQILDLIKEKTYIDNEKQAQVLTTKEIVYRVVEELSYDLDKNLETFAEKYHISYSHLSREFFAIMGVHFTDYVKHIKLNFAVHRLINTNLSLTEVAIDSRFANSQVFSRIFKKEFQMTPSQYRKINKPLKQTELSAELIENLENLLIDLKIAEQDQESMIKSYKVDLEGLRFNKLNKSWGKVIDLKQLSKEDFYIYDFVDALKSFNPDALRVDFILKEGSYCPVLGSLTDKNLIKSSFKVLLLTLQELGISLIVKINISEELLSCEEMYFKHQLALDSLLDYVSLQLGLVHLQHWGFEFYLENSKSEVNRQCFIEQSGKMINQIKKRLLLDEINWGINLGVYEQFKDFGISIKKIEKAFEGNQPQFLSLEYRMDATNEDGPDLQELSDKINLANLLSELPYQYLVDFTLNYDHQQVSVSPIKEALFSLNIIKSMLELKAEFHLTSWTIKDHQGARMGTFFNDKGMETISYYFAYFMSSLYQNFRYVEPGLILSTDFDDNYHIMLLASPESKTSAVSLKDIQPNPEHEVHLMLDNIKGNYKIVESRIPIFEFYRYHSWLSYLNADALSAQEIQYIKNKLTPEITVSIETIREAYEATLPMNPLDIVFLKFIKI